jgi:hypothetical protein
MNEVVSSYVLSRCRPVSSAGRKTLLCCVVVRRFVAMSPCRLAYTPILQLELSDNLTSWQHAARQRAVWHFVVLFLAPTRRTKAYQISHHSLAKTRQSLVTAVNIYPRARYSGLNREPVKILIKSSI